MTSSTRAHRALIPMLVTAALVGGCSSSDDAPPATDAADTTASTVAQGTVPAGPSLCDRLTEAAASQALGFPVRNSGDGTSISCVYTSAEAAHVGTVLALSASDAGDDPQRLVSAAESASSSFTALTGLGDAAYVASVNDIPQGALIVGRRQYNAVLSASPRMDLADAKSSLTKVLRAIDASLRAG